MNQWECNHRRKQFKKKQITLSPKQKRIEESSLECRIANKNNNSENDISRIRNCDPIKKASLQIIKKNNFPITFEAKQLKLLLQISNNNANALINWSKLFKNKINLSKFKAASENYDSRNFLKKKSEIISKLSTNCKVFDENFHLSKNSINNYISSGRTKIGIQVDR